jgi:pimeloyl-ACP methyl ester carboxylesterase
MTWQHHHADLGDVQIHYVAAGAGEPIVLLHGWPQTWYCWRNMIPLLADRYRAAADARDGKTIKPVLLFDAD